MKYIVIQEHYDYFGRYDFDLESYRHNWSDKITFSNLLDAFMFYKTKSSEDWDYGDSRRRTLKPIILWTEEQKPNAHNFDTPLHRRIINVPVLDADYKTISIIKTSVLDAVTFASAPEGYKYDFGKRAFVLIPEDADWYDTLPF